MSDLRTEIVTKVLNGWDAPNTQVESSLTESVFTYVQNNPSCTANDVVDNTRADLGRASAILLSLYQKGKLDRKEYPNPKPDGKRHTVYAYWPAINKFKDKGVSRLLKKPKKTIRLRDTFEMPRMKQVALEQAPIKKEFDPHAFVKGLNVHDAKEVYLLLKDVFG
jgi:hypothetical protein